MKNSVTKSDSDSQKKPGAVKATKATEMSSNNKSVPTEEEIRELAETLYQQRIYNEEPGSAVDDWLRAEDYLKLNYGQ